MVRLHVVILNWNDPAATNACVAAVAGWDRVAPVVWVVDNSAPDPAAPILLRGPRTRLIRNAANLGFAGGNNVGIRRALDDGAGAVLLMNNDAVTDEVSVGRLLAALQDQAQLGVVGPRLRQIIGTRARVSVGGRDIARHVVSHRFEDRDELPPGTGCVRPVEYVPGTAVMIRTEVLRTVGLLDEAYFFAGELADLCRRAATQGYVSAVHLDAWAQHRLDRSAAARKELYAYYVLRNRFLYVRKFHVRERQRLHTFWAAYGVALLSAHAIRGRWREARAIRLALADGIAGRHGGQNERVLGAGHAPWQEWPAPSRALE